VTRDQIEYLESLVRSNLGKRERELRKLARKSAQSDDDFERFQQHCVRRITQIEALLLELAAEKMGMSR
jgi:hypothetical protein